MRRDGWPRRLLLLGGAAALPGCGSVQEVIMESVRDSAKDAIEEAAEQVDEVIDGVVDGIVDEFTNALPDLGGLPEEGSSVPEDDAEQPD